MSFMTLQGNGPLQGNLVISGAKNAALPALAATLLTSETVHLSNLPQVADIETMGLLLGNLGAQVHHEGTKAELTCSHIGSQTAHYDLVKNMRASILVLGPLLARFGQAQVSLPGGCAIGARPVDLHLEALKKMGAQVTLEHGYIDARVDRLEGADIFFETVTVTGTENLMMAAALAKGRTFLRNAAREPEVVDLACMLRAMGAQIHGDGSDCIVIDGVPKLMGTHYSIIPDRIETGTYVCAAAITNGNLNIQQCNPSHLTHFLGDMARIGVPITTGDDWIKVSPHDGLRATDVQTQPYPGFPTDMQAQFMAVLTQARGRSIITESIFENRFMHAYELGRMGANIKIDGHTAIVNGPTPLSGAQVTATDLRASASLVIAGLIADGQTVIHDIHHLQRGYDRLSEKLSAVGALVS